MKPAYKTVNSLVNNLTSDNLKIKNAYFYKLVSYGFTRNHKKNGLYPHTPSSAVYLSREIRYYLFKDSNYQDYDLVNSHPTILYDFALNKKLSVPKLSYLVNKREQAFKEIGTENPKRDTLICLNLTQYTGKSEYLKILHKEIVSIRELIWIDFFQNDPELQKTLKENTDLNLAETQNQKVSVQSYFCFSKETNLLLKLKDYLQSQNNICVIKNYRFKSSVTNSYVVEPSGLLFTPFFDGAYVARLDENFESSVLIDDLSEFEQEVLCLTKKFKTTVRKALCDQADSLDDLTAILEQSVVEK